MQLRRTVPFIAHSVTGTHKTFLLDKIEFLNNDFSNNEIKIRLKKSLNLGQASKKLISSDEASKLVLGQYEACLEFIYSHPYWKELRDNNKDLIFPYLLECRHYLAAATFRMSQGINTSLKNDKLRDLLSEHVIEEAGHNRFFENSLMSIGCGLPAISHSRPLPTTLEWIHLMRTLSSYDPLSAALCSGLLEHTAQNKKAVKSWHDMLLEKNYLSEPAVNAIFEHVGVDFELGHGENWRKALDILEFIEIDRLSNALNAVSLVAEMIVRWLDSLRNGLSSYIVQAMPDVIIDDDNNVISYDSTATPIWPSEILGYMIHGCHLTDNIKRTIAISYAYAGKAKDKNSVNTLGSASTHFHNSLFKEDFQFNGTYHCIEKTYENWLKAVNGHWLWRDMMAKPSYALTCGWLLENYHYISSISQHTGLAISSCTDPMIRQLLVKHLEEELGHGAILENTLESSKYGNITESRPLATTVAFIGALSNLAKRDWKAYCIALCYLQMSNPKEDKQGSPEDFYRSIILQSPDTEHLLEAMKKHDQIDSGLEHFHDAKEILEALISRHTITDETIHTASLIAQLSWSFLDGIWHHYTQGDMAIIQRMQWHTGG